MGSRAILSVFSDRCSGATSPVPQQAPCAAYRYNPYDVANCKQQADNYNESYAPYAAPTDAAYTPASPADNQHTPDVLHTQLQGACTFVPYPTESYPIPECTVPRENLARVFIGQLPYRVTPMQLAWLCDTIAPGVELFHVETIMKKTGLKGKRLPTGCIHALARPEDVDYLINCLSYRVLFDDTGIWCAQNPEEQEQLQSYCSAMKHNEQMRFRDRPYQPVVVQVATSVHTKKGKKPKSKTSTATTSRRPSDPQTLPSTPGSATPPGVSPSLGVQSTTLHHSSPPPHYHQHPYYEPQPWDIPFEAEDAYLGEPMSHEEGALPDPATADMVMMEHPSHLAPMECEYTQQYVDEQQ